ncbi:MAG: sodium:glutamate symporter [Sphaerochaetaceae bacterium]|jgi:ESS family glutamate:Na+ symporter|nr:sodium:glutamate symporter [Sphaerochaetaceae bacterium]
MNWNYVVHIGVISLALLGGALLRARVKFLQRFLLPVSIIAGVFLFLFYNFIAPRLGFKSDFLGELVYHLLNISFIAMMLRVENKKEPKGSKKGILAQNVTAVIAQYGLQCFFGLIVTAILMATVMPNLFPAIGYTLVLGFELGPGQAYSIGSIWENMGFVGGSSVGLTMAAIGFFIGSFGGIILINQGIRRGWIGKDYLENLEKKSVRTGFFSRIESERPIGSYLSTDGESIDTFSYHIALVMFVYLLSWGVLTLLSKLLYLLGPLGVDLADSLWGINFIFSAFCAIAVKKFMGLVKVDTTVDNGTCNRINGLAVDLTVASSLGAINLVVVRGYWLPILLLSLVGIFITMVLLPFYTSRLYGDHQFQRMLILYGTATGTLPTGLALLRVVDPEFDTPVATDYLYSVGVVFFLAIPILLSANLPAFSVTQNKPYLFWVTVGISVVYTIGALIAYKILAKKKAFAKMSKLYYTED